MSESLPGFPTLGTFKLQRPIGKGGMATVWRAVSTVDHRPVAVKILTARSAREPRRVAAFQHEARAVAALDHPHIVPVYDYGTVPTEVAAGTNGILVDGAPFLVMPLADGGSLAAQPPSRWSQLRRDLLQVLDALAHAHARGLVHRDLKPGNVLRVDKDGHAWLTDFGLVHTTDDETRGMDGGTPYYMSPEQFIGDARAFGPWTDLYALGCMAWRLSTGRAPFVEKGWVAAAHAHTQRPLPAFEPRFPVPEDFEHWLQRLLAKRPEARYQRAADAAYALSCLLAEGDDAGSDEGLEELSTLQFAELPTTVDRLPDDDTTAPTEVFSIRRGDVPPIPRRWAVPPASQVEPPEGVGLGLLGLKEPSLTGRGNVRDHLWTRLIEVANGGGPRAVLLTGPSGVGKSRLARWLAERAHEVGAASLFRASFADPPGAEDGWAPLLHRDLRTRGLDASDALARIRRHLRTLDVHDPRLAETLTALVAPVDAAGEPTGSSKESRVAVQRFLEIASPERVSVVWLDDVHDSADAVDLVRETLEGAEGRLLFVCTLTDELLIDRPQERPAVGRLLRHPSAEEIALDPLPDADQRALFEDMLGLDPALVRTLVERTRGNPAFGVHLLTALAQAGQLAQGPNGYRVVSEDALTLRSRVDDWQRRLDQLLANASEGALRALQIAAVLGFRVDRSEWLAACRIAGAAPAELPLDWLVRSRVVVVRDDPTRPSWAFAHGWIHEAVLARVASSGEAQRLHLVCAMVLANQTGPDIPERRGRHLLAAGHPEPAFEALMDGVAARQRRHEYAGAQVLLSAAEDALEQAAVHRSDPRWGKLWVARAGGALQLAQLESALEALQHLELQPETEEWGPILTRGTLVAARAELRMGRYEQAQARFRTALEQAERMLPDRRSSALRGIGWCAMYLGDADEAERTMKQALALARADQDLTMVAECNRGLGDFMIRARRWEAAREHYEAALAIPEVQVNRVGRAECVAGLAEVLRMEGDLEGAEQGYREALALQRSVGGETAITRFNLAFIQLARGRYAQARPLLERVQGSFRARGVAAYAAFASLALAACDAAERDWTEAWDRLSEFEEAVGSRLVDPDLAWLAALIARLAAEGERSSLARSAAQLAATQYRALGDEEAALRVESAGRTG